MMHSSVKSSPPAEDALVSTTVKDVPDTTLAALLAEQFCKTPDARAVTFGDVTLTYAELDTRTAALAGALRARGVGPDAIVAIALPRTLELVIALLAVIRAGGAYVPLNPADPVARRADIIAQCAPVVLLAEETCGDAPLFAPADWPKTGDCPDPGDVASSNLALILFTSGSTGTPKGALLEHDAVINSVLCAIDNFEFGPGDKFLHKSPISFDISAWEVFMPLLSGGEVVVAPEGIHRDPREILSLIRHHDITAVFFVPTMLNLFLDVLDGEPRLKIARIIAGGEALQVAQRARVHALIDTELYNIYGPTEATVCVTKWSASAEDTSDPLPLGHPVWNTRLYVLDEEGQILPPGKVGRLWLAGRQLARGYLNQEDLTAERFVDDPFVPGARMYDSGDLAAQREDGAFIYHGRADTQIKLRGIRLEMGEIETALEAQPGIKQAAVVARDDLSKDETRLVAFCTGEVKEEAALRKALTTLLPEHAVPSRIIALDAFPFTTSGKVDRPALSKHPIEATSAPARARKTANATAQLIAEALADILDVDASEIDRAANFFDLGTNSLHLVRLREAVREKLALDFPVSDFFLYTSIDALAAHLDGTDTGSAVDVAPRKDVSSDLIAIVGMAGRFPGAGSVDAFWESIVEGREMISHFSEDELDIDPRQSDPNSQYVLSRGTMQNPDMFDAKHFGIPPREADRLDPQHRIMLEVAQTALEDAGHDPDRFAGKIGIFCGASQSSYLLNNLLGAPGAARELAAGYPVKDFATLFGNDKEFLATRLAYKLNLKGPAMTVQTACSTALTAVSQACAALREGQADMVLAGGVSVTFPTKRPYAYLPEGMASSDGHCRTFDAKASGTVFGDGAGLVVLRRLEDALADGDEVIAVIRGIGINNDGADKAGYAAPSIRAQADAIQSAHRAAGVEPRAIGYIEAHGTATPLGDPIEFTALQTAFGAGTDDTQFCALGSVKTNVGHLDVAAGVVGLIKTALVLKHGKIPPLLHYTAPNPQIDFETSAFYPVTSLTDWTRSETPRIAGVSAFGVGGTNVHLVLEEAPESDADTPARPKDEGALRVFPVSGSTPEAVAAGIADLGAFAAANPSADPDRVVATLRHGRRQFAQRGVLVARDMTELAQVASAHTSKPAKAATRPQLAFLFPGQGAQHVGMAKHLFENAQVFREALSICVDLLKPELGVNLLDVIHAPEDQAEAMTARLRDTALAQPAIFATSYALAKQWDHWGITPDAMVGHSIGEFAAATLAGVMELRDALGLIALRGRLMADLPTGVMVSVRASEDDVMPYLGAGLDLAAVNGAKAVVVAGPDAAADAILPKMEADGLIVSRLHTSHAFHSHMMDPALAPFRDAVAKLAFNPPQVPILSTVTGDWLTDEEAMSADYWANHMRSPVRFYDAMQTLWAEGQHMFLESGPGRTLSTLAGQNPARSRALASLPHAQAEDSDSHVAMLESFGQLWAQGYPVDWTRIDANRQQAARLAGLPTYPFQRTRHWVEPVDVNTTALPAADAPAEAESDAAPLQPADAGVAVRAMLSDLSGVDPSEMEGGATFLELGFDSLLLTQATREILDRFGVTVTLRELIDGLPNIDTLAAHIEANGDVAGTAPTDRTKVGWMTDIERPDPAPDSPADAHAPQPAETSAPVTRITRDTDALRPEQQAHIDRLVARFNAKTPKSKALTEEYRPYHADPRTAAGFNRLWKEAVYQIVSDRSKGSRLIDVDGNEYVDLLNGFGPGFLGHTNDMIIQAVSERMNRGYEVGPQHIEAMEAAKLFCEVTGNDRASFVCTGSEAVYAAMRLARTVTNRDKIVIFQRDYHGNFDEVLVRGLEGANGPRTLPLTPGIPSDSVKNVVVLPYGTEQSRDWIRKNADTLAAVVIEPVQSRRPELRPMEFIRDIRRITERSGTLMVFDEVVTGFRFGPRGAQAYYGVEADLVTYGKIVGGEMPVGVVAGKAHYMDTFDGGQWAYGDDSFPEAPVTFFAGTFVRHPLAMAAVRAMLTHLKKQPDLFWHTINAKGDLLAGTMDRWFKDNDMPFEMPNCGSLMYLRIGEDQKYGALMGLHMRDRGVFLLEGFPSYLTAAHSDEDIDFAIDAFKDAALEMRADGMLSGREPAAYDGPHIQAPPPLLSLPNGAEEIAAQMAAPIRPLNVPTTAAQQEIWTALKFAPDLNLAYNESVRLDLHGALDLDALQAAMGAVVQRHDALRSTFSVDGTEMVIHPDLDLEMKVTDLSQAADRDDTLAKLLRQEVEIELDVTHGPLARAQVVRMSADHHVLIFTAHHIICDGWSIDVVIRDLGVIYDAMIAGAHPKLEPVQSIIDYTAAEAAWRQTEEAGTVRTFWLEQYGDTLPVIDLPTDQPRSSERVSKGARFDLKVPAELSTRLRALARRENVTLVTLLFAAWSLQMARLARTDDMVVGLPTAGQSARGMPGVVGHCVHFLPIRTAVPSDVDMQAYLHSTRATLLNAFDHQTFTLGELVRDLRMKREEGRSVLAPLVFNFDMGIDLSNVRFGSAASTLEINPRAYEAFEIFLNLTDHTDFIQTEWSYNADLFHADTIARYADGYVALLEAFADAEPDQKLTRLSSLTTTDHQRLLIDWQGTLKPFPDDKTLAEVFAERVGKQPDDLAVVSGDTRLSYRELENGANVVAHCLMAKGIRAGDRVGLCLERSADLLAAILGTLRLGAMFVPLDPKMPKARIDYLVQDSGAATILTTAPYADAFAFSDTILVEALDANDATAADMPALSTLDPAGGAYVVYTSGSTGQPKGVVGTHCATLNRFAWMWQEYPFEPGEVMCHKTAISFIDSIWETLGPLLAGVPQVVIPQEVITEPRRFLQMLRDHGVTRLLVVPSLLRLLLDSGIALGDIAPSLRLLFTSGEKLSGDLARRFLETAPNVTLVNLYGSSEVAADVTVHEITLADLDGGDAPIGRAIDNARLYVLNPEKELVPVGAIGELYVGGPVLAAGYLGRDDLTAERFLTDPFVPGGRMFATGDLVHWRSDGVLQYHGRADYQVKLRGIRIELFEVEAALIDLAEVGEAAVILIGEDATTRLAAFVAPARGSDTRPDPLHIRKTLAESLPDYMVPEHIQVLDALPLNNSGKIDRTALPALYAIQEAPDTAADAGPETEDEHQMIAIWQRFFHGRHIGVEDNFFNIGGHSLMAVALFENIRTEMGYDLPIATLLRHQTPRALMAALKNGSVDTDAALETQKSDLIGKDQPWDTSTVIHPGPKDNPRSAIFVVGGVGGNVNNLFELGKHLGQSRPVVGFQTRGVMGHRPHDSIEEMAAENLRYMRQYQKEGPYIIAGYSGGAYTALEMVRKLEAAGETARCLLVIDMHAPHFREKVVQSYQPSLRERLSDEMVLLSGHGVGALMQRLRAKVQSRIIPRISARASQRLGITKVRLNVMRDAWLSAAQKYSGGKINTPITLFGTEPTMPSRIELASRTLDPTYGWGDLVYDGGFTEVQVEGDHLSMLTGARVEKLAADLERVISDSTTDTAK